MTFLLFCWNSQQTQLEPLDPPPKSLRCSPSLSEPLSSSAASWLNSSAPSSKSPGSFQVSQVSSLPHPLGLLFPQPYFLFPKFINGSFFFFSCTASGSLVPCSFPAYFGAFFLNLTFISGMSGHTLLNFWNVLILVFDQLLHKINLIWDDLLFSLFLLAIFTSICFLQVFWCFVSKAPSFWVDDFFVFASSHLFLSLSAHLLSPSLHLCSPAPPERVSSHLHPGPCTASPRPRLIKWRCGASQPPPPTPDPQLLHNQSD